MTLPNFLSRSILAVSLLLVIARPLSAQTLGHALNNPGRTFTAAGGIPWLEDAGTGHDAAPSVRSGQISHEQATSMITEVTGPGTLTFWWKVSSEPGFDFLSFHVDGLQVAQISGEQNWVKVTHPLAAGLHTLEWRYAKDDSLNNGQDRGWVDELALTPPPGDAESHIDARVRLSHVSKTTLISDEPGQATFTGRSILDFQRLDEADVAPVTGVIPARITWHLYDTHLLPLPPVLVSSGDHDFTVNLATHSGGASPLPSVAVADETFPFTAGANLDVNPEWTYRLVLTYSYTDANAQQVSVGTGVTIDNLQLLTVSGRLTAGPVEARFNRLGWAPATVVQEGAGHHFQVDTPPGAGWFVGDETSRFGLQFNTVYRDPNSGDLVLQAGPTVPLPSFTGESENVKYRIENSTLSHLGLQGGNLKVSLPAGMGVCQSATARLLDGEIDFGAAPITPAGAPDFATRDYSPGVLFLVHEQTPVRYVGVSLRWTVATGTFLMTGANPIYIRKRETDWLAADAAAGNILDDAAAAEKASNEAPWRRVTGTATDVSIVAVEGGAGLLTANVALGGPPQTVALHHPPGVALPLTGSGNVSVSNGAFSSSSSLPLSGPVAITYSRDGFNAGECGVSAAGPATLSMTPTGNALTMTTDGGWQAQGDLAPGSTIDWGGLHGAQPTHRLQSIDTVRLLVSGTWLDGAYTNVAGPLRASALLQSGLSSPTDAALVERPETGGFSAGLADYPGLNIRVAGGFPTATSHLGGVVMGPYDLKNLAKYYVTQAGVTGIHDAVTNSLPGTIQFYGYDSRLDGLRLSYLDSENQKSATSGGITLPQPSGFDVAFSELTFTSGGALKDALLPPNSPTVPLQYWQCTLKPDMLEFLQPSAAFCTPTSPAYLTLSGRVGLGGISPTPVRGALAFKPNGHLITPADGLVRGVDSSLPMPPNFAVKGRGTLTYPFAPATRLRFNNYPGANADPEQGFLFVAGKMDVPFFEDLPVLLHLEPVAGTSHVMGGWPSDPSQGQHGWVDGAGRSYFNDTRFDATNLGYPAGVALANFRSGLADHLYRPHVRKDWQRILEFEFPVQWNAASREFKSAADKGMNLLVLNAKGQLKGLDAAGAELAFGVEFVGLPNINTQAFSRALTDAASLDPLSLEKKLADSLTNALGNAISQPLLKEGTAALDHLLADSLDHVLEPPLRALLEAPPLTGALTNLHATLKQVHAGGGMTGVRSIPSGVLDTLRNTLISQLQDDFLAATNAASSLSGALDARLLQADSALAQLEILCAADQPAVNVPPVVNPGLPPKTQPLLQSIARQAMTAFLNSDFTTAGTSEAQTAVRKLLHDLMEDARPVLRQVSATIAQARQFIAEMRASVQGVVGGLRDLRTQMQSALNAANTLANEVVVTFINQIADSRDEARRWFDEVPVADFQRRFSKLLLEQFHKSTAEREIKKAISRLLTPVRQSAHAALNTVFGQVNNMVNQVAVELVKNFRSQIQGNPAFASLISGVGDAFQAAASGLGDFAQRYETAEAATKVIQFAKAQGYARTRGDALDELRLDASIGLAIPDQIGASVFVLIKNVQSDVPSTSCRPAGAVATEVTIGGSGGVSMKQKSGSGPKPFKARLEGRFSFPPGNGVRLPNGLDGLIDFESEMDLGLMTLKQVQLRFGLGGTEAYATAAARGSVWFVEADAHLFLGATKQLAILRNSLDPEVYDTIITRPGLAQQPVGLCLVDPLIGVYGRAGGYLSVNRLFSIPDTCLLQLNAGRHISQYVLLSGPGAGSWNAGIRDELDINGRVLCLGVSGKAGLLFNVNVDAAAIKTQGISSVLHNIEGTARGWAEGCVDYFIGKACARVDIILGVKPNPAAVPPLLIYPVAIEY